MFWQPIELGLRAAGVPDLLGMHRGVTLMIECKATSGWTVDLRPGQVAWLGRWCREGGTATVAVRRRTSGGPRSEAADELWLCDAAHARQLRAGGLRAYGTLMPAPLGRWGGGPRRWPWGLALAALARAPDVPRGP